LKPIEVPDNDTDERIFIPFTVPRKGAKPLEFKLKRMDFVAEDDFQEMVKELTDLSERKEPVLDGDGKPITRPVTDDNGEPVLEDGEPVEEVVELLYQVSDPRGYERDTILAMLKRFTTAREFAALEKCSHGQLKFIRDRWQEQSKVTLGEYWASPSSSRSTGRPSNTTSKAVGATGDQTSADESAGESSEPS
jgi:hypothetical protein